MKFEFAFRTYNSFIPNATLGLASNWIESRLDEDYGANISSVIMEACCKNVSPAKKTLEKMNQNFEAWLDELPYYELTEKNTELRMCYRAIKYTHDEVSRDSQVISVKTFQQVIAKASQLVEDVPELSRLNGFNSKKLANDLKLARSEAPENLDSLIELYGTYSHVKHT